jgi:hypothetical protein
MRNIDLRSSSQALSRLEEMSFHPRNNTVPKKINGRYSVFYRLIGLCNQSERQKAKQEEGGSGAVKAWLPPFLTLSPLS